MTTDGWATRLSVAARIIIAVICVTALGLIGSATVAVLLQQRALQERVDGSLAQEVAELRSLAAQGIDPATGERFTTVEGLFLAAMRTNVPDQDEDFLVLIDGRVPFVPSWDRRFAAEELQGLRQQAAQVTPGSQPRFGTLTEDGRTVRYAAVSVTVPGDSRTGVFVPAVDLDAHNEDIHDTTRAYALASLLTLVFVAVVSMMLIRYLLTPLRQLAATADRISSEDLSKRIPEKGADDLARLTRTVNRMLDRLEGAFTDQRALLDDVGHELRTPLTVVRGHLEVVDAADPTDVLETRDLALDELDRMGRLVDELVLLAKSSRPDFLTPSLVEIDQVVAGALDRLRPIASRDWQIDNEAHAVVSADPQRLTQALLQLASNAIRFTQEGDVVALGSSKDDETVRIWVRDTGPGVAVADQERIFERFERGREAADAAPSSGLGLSIVRAIAEAHGGVAKVVSTPGAGSTFVVEIPQERE